MQSTSIRRSSSSRTLSAHAALLLALFLWLLPPPAASAQANDVWVSREFEGVGESLVNAKTDAVLKGLRQIVGEFIRSEVRVDNETVEEVIIAFSTADGVRSEQVGQPSFTADGQVRVTMRVSVRPRQLTEEFERVAASAVFIDGETLAAEVAAARQSIEAQRALMRRLFKDLPAKLLVARLVDRDGKPITDGRPDRRDIKPLGDDVAIALNVEIYFDLPNYYRRVMPNLRTALAAVTTRQPVRINLQSPPNSSRLTGTDSRGFAALSWPSKHPFTMYPDQHPAWWEAAGPGETSFAISVGRDTYGSNEAFEVYFLQDDVANEIYAALQSNRDGGRGAVNPSISVNLVDRTGGLVLSGKTQISNPLTLLLPTARFTGGAWGEHLPVDGVLADDHQFHLTHCFLYGGSNTGGKRRYPGWLLTPRFIHMYERFASDLKAVRWELVIPRADFERLGGVAFDFDS